MYKRQGIYRGANGNFYTQQYIDKHPDQIFYPMNWVKHIYKSYTDENGISVSYTHLDVYKRQVAVYTATLSATGWSQTAPYTQTVSIEGVTAASKVDLQPTPEQLTQMITDGVTALLIANNNGTLTAYALGATPTTEMVMQLSLIHILAINLHSKYEKAIATALVRESLISGKLNNEYSFSGVRTVKISTPQTVPLVD